MIGHANSQQGIARGKLIAIIFVIAVIVVAGAAFIFSTRQDREAVQQRAVTNPSGFRETANQFVEALANNKPDITYNLMTEASKQRVGGFESWKTTVNDSFAKSKGSPVFVSALDIQDVSGAYKEQEPRLLTYRLELFNATWETSLTVVKDADSWKIDNLVTDPK